MDAHDAARAPARFGCGRQFSDRAGRADHSLQNCGVPQSGESGTAMTVKTIMVVEGDPSGDAIAADLVRALAATLPAARFIGAGGPRMAEAGVANSFDLTADAVIGLSDVFRKLPRFGRYKKELTQLAAAQKPELIILV